MAGASKDFKYYIVVIGGLTQGINRWSGSLRLWAKLLHLRSPTVSVEFFKWDSRFADIAERIFLEADGRANNVRVVVFAFSYGGGWGLPRFAAELKKRNGIKIHVAVTSDAVYRSRWFLGKFLSLVDWPIIRIPSNVELVIQFIQRSSRPRGHRIIPVNNQATKVELPVVLDSDHVHCDDAEEYHERAIAVAEEMVGVGMVGSVVHDERGVV